MAVSSLSCLGVSCPLFRQHIYTDNRSDILCQCAPKTSRPAHSLDFWVLIRTKRLFPGFELSQRSFVIRPSASFLWRLFFSTSEREVFFRMLEVRAVLKTQHRHLSDATRIS